LNMTSPIKVMIADDHALVRAGLANILTSEASIQVVAEAANGLEAIDKAAQFQPDIILMDIYMPRCTGLDAMLAIKEKQPQTRVLILTVSESEEDLFKAIKFGAEGYILKSATISEVSDAVRRTAQGEVSLSSRMAARLMAEFRDKNEPGIKLSDREREVLILVGEGLTNLEIAGRLFIGESTVRTHLQRLLDKMHLKNRAEAIAYANRHNITKRN
jgi:DNA-binding NarL/FixJ family response regulator